ncbi:C-type lectin [Plakobranchus ocellatus]|uniref:C-type lectin n=1 Tax=Plakobranchus ocellatus TaxID=259542 RepID=A0AAV3Y5Q8_9GAST|nr:C-type lectin [Plakobranchus ocellatus]
MSSLTCSASFSSCVRSTILRSAASSFQKTSAIMFLSTAWLLLAVMVALSSQAERSVVLNVVKPSSSRDGLSVRCTFDIRLSSEIKTIQSMKMQRRLALSNIPYSEVATITPSGKVNRLGNEITLSGDVGNGSYSGLYIKYASPDAGYCTIYRCLVKGTNSKGWTKYEDYNIGTGGKNGGRCYRPGEEPAQCVAEAETVKELEKQLNEYAAQLAGFTNLFSINKDTYLVSALHEGRVYTMNKKTERFSLQKMNDRCKEIGGYLVEIDNQDEQEFVAKFSTLLGNKMVYTGANDIQKEGTFVQYNSKKLVSNVKWMEGEPSNYRGVEHCVVLRTYGLNDIMCGRTYRYICEIPLV